MSENVDTQKTGELDIEQTQTIDDASVAEAFAPEKLYLVTVADVKHADGSKLSGVGRVVCGGPTKEEAKISA